MENVNYVLNRGGVLLKVSDMEFADTIKNTDSDNKVRGTMATGMFRRGFANIGDMTVNDLIKLCEQCDLKITLMLDI